jgi:aspartate/methionine/tyrosine aminotransferase
MDPAADLNAALLRAHPAAARCLSPLGRRLYFPKGIPVQSREAAGARYNATIGQLRGADGHAAPLPALAPMLQGVDPDEAFLYAPQGGLPRLRQAWARRLAARAAPGAAPTLSLPFVTGGITHALSLLADLFVGPETRVLLPDPAWDNYIHIFGTKAEGRLSTYRAVGPAGLDLDALAQGLAALQGPALVVLNLPSNPGGYAPTLDQAEQLAQLLAAQPGPLVVLLDDAYQGMVWDEGHLAQSLLHRLGALADPERLLVVSADGATKELFFFGGRVAFATFATTAEAAPALEEKLTAAVRVSVSCASSPAQAMVATALADPEIDAQRDVLHADLAGRWRALRGALAAEGVEAWPFNAAFFALLPVRGEPEALRRALLADGLGLVSAGAGQNLRLSYATLQADEMGPVAAILAKRLRA